MLHTSWGRKLWLFGPMGDEGREDGASKTMWREARMISVFGKSGRRRACALTSRALHCTKYESTR